MPSNSAVLRYRSPESGSIDDDGLALVLRTLGDARGDGGGGSARNARQDSFFAGQPARVLDRLFVGDLLDGVDHRQVEIFRHEARADALDFMRARFERLAAALLRDDGTRSRLDGDR